MVRGRQVIDCTHSTTNLKCTHDIMLESAIVAILDEFPAFTLKLLQNQYLRIPMVEKVKVGEGSKLGSIFTLKSRNKNNLHSR
jgi:hypothetical protein